MKVQQRTGAQPGGTGQEARGQPDRHAVDEELLHRAGAGGPGGKKQRSKEVLAELPVSEPRFRRVRFKRKSVDQNGPAGQETALCTRWRPSATCRTREPAAAPRSVTSAASRN